MMIQISGDYGEPKADGLFWPLQKRLNDCFKKYMVGIYFNTIALLSIVFRVSGKITDFGSEGPDRLKFIRKDSELTIDFVFAESSWRGVDREHLTTVVGSGVRVCLDMLIKKAEELGEVNDLEALMADIEKALAEFCSD